MGVANHRSLSWAIAQCLSQAGARLCLTYANERLKPAVEELAATLPHAFTTECDVTKDYEIDEVAKKIAGRWGSLEMLVHGIAFARKEDLEGSFVKTPREGFQLALDVSAYSFINVTNRMLPLHGEERRQRDHAHLPGRQPRDAELQRDGQRQGGARADHAAAGVRAGREEHPRQRALGRPGEHAGRARHPRLHRHAQGARAAPRRSSATSPRRKSARRALFLLSDLASGITGTTLYVDAGWHILGM